MILNCCDTLFDYLDKIYIPNGEHTLILANGEEIDIELYNYFGQNINSTSLSTGSSISDTKMLVIRVYGNLNINNNYTPKVRKKGMCIFCTNTITNNHTISMTARGAIAEGQEVLLFKNKDGSYEYVPKEGAKGGERYTYITLNSSTTKLEGNKGSDGINRQTGGGGSGNLYLWFCRNYCNGIKLISGSGSNGTSYSGGSGGGGVANYSTPIVQAMDADINGGAGGNAKSAYAQTYGWIGYGYGYGYSNYNIYTGGGAGNPGGKGAYSTVVNYEGTKGGDGTGGLLIIYSTKIINNGDIVSKGSNGGITSVSAEGGGSGGGSINIFTTLFENNGVVNADGGLVSGGNGSITITQIKDIYNTDNIGVYKCKVYNELLDTMKYNTSISKEYEIMSKLNNVYIQRDRRNMQL